MCPTEGMPSSFISLLEAEKQIIRLESHLSFLSDCKKEGMYPQRLSLSKTPNVSTKLFPPLFETGWNNALSSASLLLTDHLIYFYGFAIQEAELLRESVVNEIIDSQGLSTYLRFASDIKRTISSFSQRLKYGKELKLHKLRTKGTTKHKTEPRDWWSSHHQDTSVLCGALNCSDTSDGFSSGMYGTTDTRPTHTTPTSEAGGYQFCNVSSSQPPTSPLEVVPVHVPHRLSSMLATDSVTTPTVSEPFTNVADRPFAFEPMEHSNTDTPRPPNRAISNNDLLVSDTVPNLNINSSCSDSFLQTSDDSLNPVSNSTLVANTAIKPSTDPINTRVDNPEPGFLAHTKAPITLRADEFSSVVNLSSTFEPSRSQLSVLAKGVNFCPVPQQIDELQVRLDLAAWKRRVRLAEFFSDKPSEKDFSPDPFKPKSSWNPPRRCHFTENYLKTVESEVVRELHKGKRFHQNLNASERKAIKELNSNPEIVIKQADKGSGTVIVDKKRYVREGLRQLGDNSTYRKLDKDPTTEVESRLQKLVAKAFENGTISKDMATYAIPVEHKLSRFYLLPKIHKAGVPGRPEVSCCGSLTENLSEIVDFLLKPFLSSVTSYLRDTKHFLSKVRQLDNLPQGALLVSLDVVNLYPSIPHEDGLSALSAFLEQQGVSESSRSDIVKLAQFVLVNNVFEFDNQIYIQVSGTASGHAWPLRMPLYSCICWKRS